MYPLLAMFLFSLAMSISPGPVNMVILSSGVNYGIQRTISYVSGATVGFTLLLLFIGFGFFEFIKSYPFFLTYLAIGGSLYIMYIGYKIASAKPEIEVNKQIKIPKFYEGFLLQWLNAKAWIACVSGISLFSSTQSYVPFLIFSGVYFLVCYASLALWAIMGAKVSYLLTSHFRLRLFNLVTGLLLIVTAVYLCYTHLRNGNGYI
jgi:threonine/homoserine/homoserine lactone efflux protein